MHDELRGQTTKATNGFRHKAILVAVLEWQFTQRVLPLQRRGGGGGGGGGRGGGGNGLDLFHNHPQT